MPTGTCKKCHKKYYGWALMQAEHRKCECGGEVELTSDPAPREEVTVLDETGHQLNEEQTRKILKAFQAGVFYVGQGR